MSTFDNLEQLLAEYENLLHGPRTKLNYDQRRGIRFYLAEHALVVRDEVPSEVGTQILNWTLRRERLEAFQRVNGRMPRENSRLPAGAISEEERFLAEWTRTRRKAHREGALCSYQVRRLECIDGFQWDPRATAWSEHVDDYASFLHDHGAAPSGRSTNPLERSLAKWATIQRKAHRTGKLSLEQGRALASLSIWTW